MKAAKPLILIFACIAVYFFQLSFSNAQTMQGVYSGNIAGELSVITLEQKGEMVYGQLYDSQMNKSEFFGAKEKTGFRGVMEISGEEKEVSAKNRKINPFIDSQKEWRGFYDGLGFQKFGL